MVKEDGRALARDLADDVKNVIAGLWINPDGRFVQQQYFGPMHQADGKVEPTFHAAGKAPHRVGWRGVGQADAGQDFVNALLKFGNVAQIA